jgi:hypothetical protein
LWQRFTANKPDSLRVWVVRLAWSASNFQRLLSAVVMTVWLGLKALRDSIETFGEGNPLTALCPKIDDVTDPDDAFSSVTNLLDMLDFVSSVDKRQS